MAGQDQYWFLASAPHHPATYRVGKEHSPFVANPFMKIDRAVGCVCLEVRRDAPKAKTTDTTYEQVMVQMAGYSEQSLRRWSLLGRHA